MGQTIATNKKAYHNFHLTDKWECGIVLVGSEVKSVRDGYLSFKDSFARVENGEVILYSFHIEPYKQASYMNLSPDRERKLLLHKREIKKIDGAVTAKNLTLVPTKVYFNNRGLVKIEIAVGQGKKMFDKREDIKKRDIDRDMKRAMRNTRR